MKKSVFFYIIILTSASIAPIHAALTMIENEKQFDEIVNGNTPSVIVFSAEWCGGCKALKEPFQKVVDNPVFKYVTFAKVDVDKNNELSKRYNIRYLPTILFMQAGQKKHEIIGIESEQTIGAAINKTFALNTPISSETHETLPPSTKKNEAVAQKVNAPEPAESAGTFQVVSNIIASIFISIKNAIANFFTALISTFKNLF